MPVPLSQQLRAFHADMARYHRRMAREHVAAVATMVRLCGTEQAADAHEAAASVPLDEKVARVAIASHRVGIDPAVDALAFFAP